MTDEPPITAPAAPVVPPVAKPKLRLVDNAWVRFHGLWSNRVQIASAVFGSMALATSWFADVFNPWFLLALLIVLNLVTLALSTVKQDGLPPAHSGDGA